MDLNTIYKNILLSEHIHVVEYCSNWIKNLPDQVCNHTKVRYCMYLGFMFGDLKMMKDSITLYKEAITEICENPEKLIVTSHHNDIIHNGNDEAYRQTMDHFRIFQLDYDKMLNICIKTLVQSKKYLIKLKKIKKKKK